MFWKKPFRKHCNDELLLGYLDGELSLPIDSIVRKHLNTCWECRGRLAELEEQAVLVAKEFAHEIFPGPDRVEDARQGFSVWQQRFERRFDPGPNLLLLAPTSFSIRPIAAVGFFCLIIAGLWSSYRFHKPGAGDVLAATQRFERKFYEVPLPLHQSLRIEVAQVKPRKRRRAGTLEVWSEPKGARFASRWRADDGTLQYALWKPDKNRKYVLNTMIGPGVSLVSQQTKVTSLLQMSTGVLEMEQVETEFLRWLQSREWRPVSFASELSVFADQDGVTLRRESVRSEDGRPAVRLSAQRASAGLRVEIVLEVDARTYQPRFEKVRFEGPSGEVEVYLGVERMESIPPSRLAATVFQPDALPEPPVAHLAVTRRRPSPHEFKQPEPPAVFEAKPDPAALVAAEIEANYALHRAGACLGEPIDIFRDPAGYVQIRGLVNTQGRKLELIKSVKKLKGAPLVRVDIQTLEEASVEQLARALDSRTEIQIFADRLPVEDQLKQFLANHGDAKDGGKGRQIAELTNEAVSASVDTLAHAWALRRLTQRYGAVKRTR
jgi:hypothetical protein